MGRVWNFSLSVIGHSDGAIFLGKIALAEICLPTGNWHIYVPTTFVVAGKISVKPAPKCPNQVRQSGADLIAPQSRFPIGFLWWTWFLRVFVRRWAQTSIKRKMAKIYRNDFNLLQTGFFCPPIYIQLIHPILSVWQIGVIGRSILWAEQTT